MNARRGRSGLQGVLDRLGAWNRSPRNPAEQHELSAKDLGRLHRVFARLADAPELSERRRIAAELVTMWAEDVPSARPNLLAALAQRSLPGAAQRADLAALGTSAPTSADPQVRLDLLREAAPNGIDLYYDNVGGEQLEAALEVLNSGGRAVICGAVSGGSDSGPANYRNLIYQELTMRGFTVTAHEDLREEFEERVSGWLNDGKVQSLHTVFDGIESVPEAFESLLSGGSIGRVLVPVPSPSS